MPATELRIKPPCDGGGGLPARGSRILEKNHETSQSSETCCHIVGRVGICRGSGGSAGAAGERGVAARRGEDAFGRRSCGARACECRGSGNARRDRGAVQGSGIAAGEQWKLVSGCAHGFDDGFGLFTADGFGRRQGAELCAWHGLCGGQLSRGARNFGQGQRTGVRWLWRERAGTGVE